MGENGFLTITGRFHNPPFGNDGRRSDKMQPWSLSAGVTVPIEKVVDKFVEGAKTVFDQ